MQEILATLIKLNKLIFKLVTMCSPQLRRISKTKDSNIFLELKKL